jgi:hypothetical protein
MEGGEELPMSDSTRRAPSLVSLATIEDPQVIRKILAHLGLPTEVPRPRPSRGSTRTPWGWFF